MDPDELERTSVPEVEEKIELCETYIRAGWDDAVESHIEEVEEYGIDFKQLADAAPGISDPR